jgi:hypothetical protein|nr:MAG TPA: hypothetical protein [Caudoviricetes sp.]
MGRARNAQANAEAEEKLETANAEEIANTGDEAVDAFLNGEIDEVPEGTEEITEEEAKDLEAQANAEAEEGEEDVEAGVEYVIEAPNKAYTGTTATVDFKDGKGVTANKVIIDYFKARGYKVTKK